MGRPLGSRNKAASAAEFSIAFAKAARKVKLNIHLALAELCQDEDKSIRLQAIRTAVALMHARPTPVVIPIASDMQLSFLPADAPPTGNIYEGEQLGGD